jgi:uncharacterized protein with PQ loop repeat
MPEALGWVGLLLIGFAAIPQTIKVLRQGHGDGLAWPYLLFLWLGFFAMFWYALLTHVGPALILNYALQWLLFSIMIYVKRNPRPPSTT